MSEFVGVEEEWVEKGWTRKQMRDRIEELGLTMNENLCVLQPYELNFMQNPNANADTLKMVEQMSTTGDYNFTKSVRNLWTPGESITVSFTGGSTSQQESCKKYIMQDIQPYVSMKFSFVTSGARISVSFENMSNGGLSPIGKSNGNQWVKFGVNAFRDSGSAFNYARYLTCHEFGHTLGLFHEFDTCSGNMTCTAPDPYSVMNYPAGSSGGAGNARPSAQCMDHYSPNDVEWLTKVYKGTGKPGQTDKPPPGGKTQKPPPGGKTQKPPPGGKTQKPPPGGKTPKPPPGGKTQKPPPGGKTQKPPPPPPQPTQPPPPPPPRPTQPPPPQPTQPPPQPTQPPPPPGIPTSPPKFNIVTIVFISVFVLILLVLLYVLVRK